MQHKASDLADKTVKWNPQALSVIEFFPPLSSAIIVSG